MEAPESLLEHATWLRRLAASLVGDRSTADDLVQETWVAALRRPPSSDRPVRPWLARVLRNAARFRWRSDTNRAARETVAAATDAAAPSGEELLARHQLQQLLAKLVEQLDEPYRATILLRYAEGLEPIAIARKLGVPASTVRWRVKEALERLRRGLDDAHEGDRKTWLRALAPIALWSRPSRAAAAVAIAIVVAAAAAITLASTRHGATARPEAARAIAVARSSVGQRAQRPGTHSWFVQPGAPTRHVTGRVTRDHAPVPGALVRLVPDDGDPVEVRSDGRGRFDFGDQDPRTISVGAAAGDALASIAHVDLRDPTAGSDLELELTACSAWIAGHVTDAAGNPIAHAQVLREDTIGTHSDASGAYELCARPTAALVSQLDIVVRADGYGAVAAGVAPAGHIQRDFVLAPEATITGTAAPDASVWIEPDRDDVSLSGERGARLVARADAAGHFHITGASGGRYRVGAAAHGTFAVTKLVSVPPAGSADVTLEMIASATVHGRVVMHGAPVPGARVRVRTDHVVVRHDDPSRDTVAAGSAVTQADGTFVVDGLPPGRITLEAAPVKLISNPVELVAGDNSVTLEAQPLGRIRGFVRRHGQPVPFARVDIAGGPSAVGITADATGHYEADGLEAGSYGFYADDGHRGAYFTGGDLVTVADGETRDYDVELVWGARISGTVVDASGAPVPNVSVRFRAADTEEGRCTTDARGEFACGSLQGRKTYVPSVMPGDNASRPFPFATPASNIELASDGAATGIVLAIDPRTTTIDGVVVDESGVPAVDVRVRATGTGIQHDEWVAMPTAVTDGDGRFHLAQLPPGDYELVAGAGAKRVVAAGTSGVVLTLARSSCAATEVPTVSHRPTSPIVWDDRIELVGWDLPTAARVGDEVAVTLVFRARAQVLYPWKLFAFFDSDKRRHPADHVPVGDSCGTATWKPGGVYVDRFTTKLANAETFTLKIGFFRPSEGDGPWQHLAGPGDPVSGLPIGTIAVVP